MKEVGAGCASIGKRGSVIPGVRDFICGSYAGIPFLWVRGVRYFTTHWEDFGRIPPQGGPQGGPHTYRESTAEGNG